MLKQGPDTRTFSLAAIQDASADMPAAGAETRTCVPCQPGGGHDEHRALLTMFYRLVGESKAPYSYNATLTATFSSGKTGVTVLLSFHVALDFSKQIDLLPPFNKRIEGNIPSPEPRTPQERRGSSWRCIERLRKKAVSWVDVVVVVKHLPSGTRLDNHVRRVELPI